MGNFGVNKSPFGFGTVAGWQSEMGGTTTGGTGTSPGTEQDGRWPPGVIPPTKWCIKETTIHGSIQCIPPIPGREARTGDQPPEMRIQIDVDWKVECPCGPVNVDSEGIPSTPWDPPPGGTISAYCENEKRNFHFFDSKYEYNCLPITGGSSGYGEYPERTRVLSTSSKKCLCVNPSGGDTPANTCSGKKIIIMDLKDPNVWPIFRLGDRWHSNGAEATWNPVGFADYDPPPGDPSMKAALEKCRVKKIPFQYANQTLFHYELEDYDDGSRSAQDQIDCLNNLICCEGEESEQTSNAARGVIKKLINDHITTRVVPPFTKCDTVLVTQL